MSKSIHPSICPLDCPDACSLDVEVVDGRVTRIEGSDRNPLTRGIICAKVRSQMIAQIYGEERLRRPLVRTGAKGEGRFEPVSWEQVLDRVADRLVAVRDEFGGEAILPVSYGGSNGFLSQDNTDARLFRRLGASRLARNVCAAPSAAAAGGLYGKMPGVALPDYAHAAGIIVWGGNPAATGIHLMPILQEAKRNGAWLAVVDPRRTDVAKIADLHLPLRPGTDLPVALSIIAWLFASGHADRDFLSVHARGADELESRAAVWDFERAARTAGVDAAGIAELAQRYADTEPAVIRCGWGLERNRNGGSAVAAVLALPAVAGKFGIRAGGYTMSNSPAWGVDATQAAHAEEQETRTVNLNLVGEALLHAEAPPVKAMFVYNCNPLATLPAQGKMRRGMERDDLFTVVFDQVMTDSARYADVVLPATTFLERPELARGYGAYVMHRSEAVIDPVGEARSNHEVFADLCRRVGVAQPGDPESSGDLVAAMVGACIGGDAIQQALDQEGIAFPVFGDMPIQFVDVFPRTTDSKVHLVPDALDAEAAAHGGLYHYEDDPGSVRYPLALISPAHKMMVTSTFGQLRKDVVPVQLHPDDAEARSIGEGDEVCVFNGQGEVHCPATINPELRRGVVCLPKGAWDHNSLNGSTGNVLVPDTLTDIGAGACFNDTRVQIRTL